MSKVRLSILAALAAIGFGVCGASSVSAAPANGTVISQIASTGTIQKVYYWGYGYYRAYYRPYYRPYYGYYRPYYYRPYYRPYYGYYRPYYYRPYYYSYYW